MQYRNDKYGNPISILGFGCMRFTKKGSGFDFEKAEHELMLAFENGVNYYDTAYLYPGSEELLGKVLVNNGIRDKINIATKLPQYMVRNAEAIDKYFYEELRRLQTDHVDYYLMHHVTDLAQWERLKGFGIEEWIRKKKESGQIRNIGFSYHGNSDWFLKVLDSYDWDFCQIQYNYMDENSQAGRIGLESAEAKGIPVMIMEPLRGGRLLQNIPVKAREMVQREMPDTTLAKLAFKWLWNQSGVTCVLSGMNSSEMVEENCKSASEAAPGCLSEEEQQMISRIKKIISETEKVGCTGCRYCMPCPAGVDIPGNFYYYNQMYSESRFGARKDFTQALALRKDPPYASLCVKCGKCEQHCPQEIPIREKLVEADKALRPWPYKVAAAVVRKFMVRK